jgi:uncharacterized protein YdhG (YjbR/CyaY superfamily)
MATNNSAIENYIASISEEKRVAMETLRKSIAKNLPKGFTETFAYGMITYCVPHSLYPKGYHCDPKQALPFISIAAQKNFIALYHMGLYADATLLQWFQDTWKNTTDSKLDMGKSCIRFKRPNDIPFELIKKLVSKVTVKEWISLYEKSFVKK